MFNGLKRGLQIIVDVLRFLTSAFLENDELRQMAALKVVGLWIVEVTDAKGVAVKGNIAMILLLSDPFMGSRAAAQAMFAQYGKP
jgi:spore maturation protein SpmB